MKDSDLSKVVQDLSLTSDALRCVLFVRSKGKGEHRISHDEFSVILNHAGRDKVRRALKLAERSGWLESARKGWGEPLEWTFTVCLKTRHTVEPKVRRETRHTVEPPEGRKTRHTEPSVTENTSHYARMRTEESLDDVVVEEEVVVDRENAREGAQESLPWGNELDPRVETSFRGAEWDGFRNALIDYFRDRVDTAAQWGYLNTVKTWLDGGIAAPKGLAELHPNQQRLLIASALNELLQQTPADEKREFRSSRGQVGKTNVLRAKCEYLLDRRKARGGPSTGSGTRAAGGRSSIGANFTGFPEDR